METEAKTQTPSKSSLRRTDADGGTDADSGSQGGSHFERIGGVYERVKIREKVENCPPSLRFSVTLCPGSGEVLLKWTCHSDDLFIHFALAQERFCCKGPGSTAKRGHVSAQASQAGHGTSLLFLWLKFTRFSLVCGLSADLCWLRTPKATSQ